MTDRAWRALIIVVTCLVALLPAICVDRALAAQPGIVSRPAEAYRDFTPLREPRVSVPVGALWIQNYGPFGAGASPDNLETIRGLNGLTINRNLQLSLTAGVFDLLGIDPGLRNQVSARFSDLSIVRVRDLAELDGPAGEPRIYEALKAGSVTITTEHNLSLSLDAGAFYPVEGRGAAGRARGTTLEARDMFIALRVITPRTLRRHERNLSLGRDAQASATLDQYRVRVSATTLRDCLDGVKTAEEATECSREHPLTLTVTRASTGNRAALETRTAEWTIGDGPRRIALSVPLSVGSGGLLLDLSLEPQISVEEVRTGRTTRFRINPRSRVTIALEGMRAVTMSQPNGWDW